MKIEDLQKYQSHPDGYTKEDLKKILDDNPEINEKYFFNALMGNTCLVDNGKIINYPWDVEKAIQCGLEQRQLRVGEWD